MIAKGRWAVWTRMTIPCREGLIYLVRRRIVQTPWFGIYVHDIHEPDGSDPHDHPWSFISVVLRGHYVERVFADPLRSRSNVRRLHRRFSVHRMGRSSGHKIIEVSPRLVTLIIVGPRRGDWGFYQRTDEGCEFIPWQEYEGRPKAYGVGSSVPS